MDAKKSRGLDNKIRNFLKHHKRPEHFDVDGQIEESSSSEFNGERGAGVHAQAGSVLERSVSQDENQQG